MVSSARSSSPFMGFPGHSKRAWTRKNNSEGYWRGARTLRSGDGKKARKHQGRESNEGECCALTSFSEAFCGGLVVLGRRKKHRYRHTPVQRSAPPDAGDGVPPEGEPFWGTHRPAKTSRPCPGALNAPSGQEQKPIRLIFLQPLSPADNDNSPECGDSCRAHHHLSGAFHDSCSSCGD